MRARRGNGNDKKNKKKKKLKANQRNVRRPDTSTACFGKIHVTFKQVKPDHFFQIVSASRKRPKRKQETQQTCSLPRRDDTVKSVAGPEKTNLEQSIPFSAMHITRQDKKFYHMCKYTVNMVDRLVAASENRGRSRLERPAEHGKRKQSRLPVLVWHPSTKEMNRIVHSLNGNTTDSKTGTDRAVEILISNDSHSTRLPPKNLILRNRV